MGFELMTSSLPRMRSTPELHRLKLERGRRIELPFPAWKAGIIAIIRTPLGSSRFCPTSAFCGQGWIRTTEGIASRFTVCPIWPLWYLPKFSIYIADGEPMEGIEPTTLRLQITRSSQLSYIGNVLFQSPLVFGTAKIGIISYSPKTFFKLFLIPSASIPHSACCWDCDACAMKLSGMPSPLRVAWPGWAASHSLTAP